MKIGIFGGSFDPVHCEHVQFVAEAVSSLRLDRVFVVPSRIAPHKKEGAFVGGEDRLACCRLAFSRLPQAEVSDFELNRDGTSYTYLTLRHFKKLFPDDELFLLVGADMLEDFFTWKNPEEIVSMATPVACGRGTEETERLKGRFVQTFGREFIPLSFTGKEVSSTEIRCDLAFRKSNPYLDPAVAGYLRERGLYGYPCIDRALSLETPSRREHSYRVAVMAVKRARSAGLPEEKALLAAALHDCAKYLPPDSPLLRGFVPPDGVPSPVLHQYAGAFVAERELGITDGEILDAIRFHTSGRENMTPLETLIFLADLLEPERSFSDVGRLRALFWQDLDECLYQSLSSQIEYLLSGGNPVYPLTERAFEFIKQKRDHKENL